MTDNIARQPAGIPTGGQFATTSHSEPGISLAGSHSPSELVLPEDTFLGRHASCPEPRPAEWVFGEHASVDAVVGTVMDGPLSRGVVNAQRRAAFNAWHEWAMAKALETKDPAYDDFAQGLRTGVASLYERRMDHYEPGLDRFKPGGTPVYVADHALQVSGSKRTSFEDREHWRTLLKRTPSEAWHRGYLAAGLLLSGADGYWGLRESAETTVLGPSGDNASDDVDTATDESNQIFDFEIMVEEGLATYSVDDLGGGSYAMYAEDGTTIEFEHHGDTEDNYSIQDKAAAALKSRGIIDDDTWIS
ncbi:hypothetical protein Achl_4202 (plasmid) [Pseudarthrobacter chlorophenolicus A6]|uniref:Uncharacterized protein n=1 Tax=Pseudarthrobacter chlorophenolicus (strain ATCC 700700 / DSM 12829 / CIP 107037 / JCM 12360 / KCTC 9906 / NCIMB 13794 / A6) TaxID=452863 RepID=B8HIA6_PSECP|nr:hypothetical protein [Pseudarthrobacter chlorophenolicus]ACL42153.1 hypothetical protein Achl_4202 [Pseudarthrobacter chlorophenolicus A6]SDQ14133.1 hypothetical protein SAMN04489738_0260 [Pseudarthrobacter chlorophenolicus]